MRAVCAKISVELKTTAAKKGRRKTVVMVKLVETTHMCVSSICHVMVEIHAVVWEITSAWKEKGTVTVIATVHQDFIVALTTVMGLTLILVMTAVLKVSISHKVLSDSRNTQLAWSKTRLGS